MVPAHMQGMTANRSGSATARRTRPQPGEPADRFITYTPEQVARMVGGSVWWVKELARRQQVPHLRLGRAKIMFQPSDVQALLDLCAVPVAERAQVADPVAEAIDAAVLPTLEDIARSAGVTRRGAARLRSLGA